MAASLSGLQHKISGRTFGAGLGIIAIVCAGLIAFLWLKSPQTLLKRSEKLASQTVMIQRDALPEQPPVTEEQAHAEDLSAEDHQAVVTPLAEEPPVTAPETVADVHTPEPVIEEPVTEPTAATAEDDSGSLAQAPIAGLYADTTDGRLPIIRASDKMTPFQAYRRTFTPVAGKPFISIVVMDVGLSNTASQAVMSDLSPEVTVAVSPYAPSPEFWMNESRFRGHETWLKLPVEPALYPLDDTGPQTLLINAVERQNLNKLNWAMSRGSGYAGFVTGYQPAFMKSANDVRPIVHEIYSRGLGFVDGDIAPSSVPESIAAGLNGAYAHNDVWIDIPSTREHIAASLRQLEVNAQSNGRAIGFIHSTPMGLRMLQSWIDGLDQKGFVIAPLSAQSDFQSGNTAVPVTPSTPAVPAPTATAH